MTQSAVFTCALTVLANAFNPESTFVLDHRTLPNMSKKILQQKDQIVKLIVGAGQASPSPPVGPALGSKGVKSMDFCKVLGLRWAVWKSFANMRSRSSMLGQRI